MPLARGEVDGLSQPVPEPGILLAEAFVLLDQFGMGRPSGMLDLDGGLDLLGMVVDGLSAAVGGLSLPGDVTIAAGESRRGVGDPDGQGYLEHGAGTPECGSRSNPTLKVHPHDPSRDVM